MRKMLGSLRIILVQSVIMRKIILIKFGLLHRAFSERALGKRRKTVTSEPEIEEGYEQNDNDDEVHLPLPTLSSGC